MARTPSIKWNGDVSEDGRLCIIRVGVREGSGWDYSYQLMKNIGALGWDLVQWCDSRAEAKAEANRLAREGKL